MKDSDNEIERIIGKTKLDDEYSLSNSEIGDRKEFQIRFKDDGDEERGNGQVNGRINEKTIKRGIEIQNEKPFQNNAKFYRNNESSCFSLEEILGLDTNNVTRSAKKTEPLGELFDFPENNQSRFNKITNYETIYCIEQMQPSTGQYGNGMQPTIGQYGNGMYPITQQDNLVQSLNQHLFNDSYKKPHDNQRSPIQSLNTQALNMQSQSIQPLNTQSLNLHLSNTQQTSTHPMNTHPMNTQQINPNLLNESSNIQFNNQYLMDDSVDQYYSNPQQSENKGSKASLYSGSYLDKSNDSQPNYTGGNQYNPYSKEGHPIQPKNSIDFNKKVNDFNVIGSESIVNGADFVKTDPLDQNFVFSMDYNQGNSVEFIKTQSTDYNRVDYNNRMAYNNRGLSGDLIDYNEDGRNASHPKLSNHSASDPALFRNPIYFQSNFNPNAYNRVKRRRRLNSNTCNYTTFHPSKLSSIDYVFGNLNNKQPEKPDLISPVANNSENAKHFENLKKKINGIDFDNITVLELKTLMKDFGVNPNGKKQEMIDRLQKKIKELGTVGNINGLPRNSNVNNLKENVSFDGFFF
jgi:hypothetical protein